MKSIEVQLEGLKVNVEYIKKAIDDFLSERKDYEKKIDDKMDGFKNFFAAKWTESFCKSIIFIVLVYFLNGLLSLFHLPNLSNLL